jgi:hypothetical protein
MKDIHRNPNLYYILAPAVIAMWPLLVWAVYLPRAERNWKGDKDNYLKAQKTIGEILYHDPDRLNLKDANKTEDTFDYVVAVDEIARSCGIPSSLYKLNSRTPVTSRGIRSQSCRVTLNQIDVARFAKFLSDIQLRWPNLQCQTIGVRKKKGIPDQWQIDLDFKYYY